MNEPTVSASVTAITSEEMGAIRAMHRVGQKYGIALVCARCVNAFQGANNGEGSTQAISCGCRELRATVLHRG